ncbi:MAG: sensor histidine kinase [Rhodospirillales bacterium]|nr:sensor histidine kinase [Rhodospirillales bacterium]
MVSTVPVALLAVWEQQQSLDREVASVSEKHLLVARNLTTALDRYIRDAQSVFLATGNHLSGDGKQFDFHEVLSTMGFRHVCVVDAEGYIQRLQCAADCVKTVQFPAAVFHSLASVRAQAQASPGMLIMSDLLRNQAGQPSLYMVRANAGGLMTIGELDTEYPQKIQKSISFGRGGHAAIVDSTGRIIAHPLDDWVAEMKDISGLSVVRKMIQGETGVIQFFSPAAKAQMVAGYNVVPRTGWGVMIPQPYQELVDKSNGLRLVGVAIAAVGIVIAIAISWWLSGMLARPLSNIADIAMRVADGDMTLRVPDSRRLHLRETRDLTHAFNHMLERIDSANTALEVASRQALAANRSKSEFLANMSHELRTPLNAVIGFSDMIRHQRLGAIDNAVYVQYATDIQLSSQHLLELINDILDLSVVEQGKLILHKELLAIEPVIQECIKLAIESKFQNGAAFLTDIPENLPPLFVDRRAFKQVVLNLLSNSAKFTPRDGQVTLSVALLNGCHVISIRDTGIGIPKNKLATITNPFVRSETNSYKTQQGTGLGLAIVKSLVELHGGTLVLESDQDRGTVVTVTLPMGRVGSQSSLPI